MQLKTLLHICCAPCSISCIEQLRGEGIEPVGFWFNPNIHPFTEYENRRNALREYSDSIGLSVVYKENYGLRTFVKNVVTQIDDRCSFCYRWRLEVTAKYAAENGFESFTSTLFISPYQNHELMKQIAEEVAEKYGVNFLYRDFRPYFRGGQTKARECELYMQKYCGCIFSEEDRYRKKIEKLYKG